MAWIRTPQQLLTLFFLAIISAPGLIQCGIELARGERPRVLDVFTRRPTAVSLRSYEETLEETSWVAQTLRPWMQYAQFILLHEAGEKALIGREGWLFYKPGVQYITRRAPRAALAPPTTDAVQAILDFRDQLAARGVRLLVLPMPNKESVYPEKLSARTPARQGVISPDTERVLGALRAGGVEVFDAFAFLAASRRTDNAPGAQPFYLAQDSHWSPRAVELTARAVADRLVQLGWVTTGGAHWKTSASPVDRVGDVLRMLQAPPLERRFRPESVVCTQVTPGQNPAVPDNSYAQVLVLGDSFCRIYEQNSPGAAGFVAHLGKELKQPVASIINDGGASTLVRQELHRRPNLLLGKKVVVWEFVERDLRLGTEGWQIVPLPTLE